MPYSDYNFKVKNNNQSDM